MKARTEQIEVRYDALGNVTEAILTIVVHKDNIYLIRLEFERTYDGVTYECEIRGNGLVHFGDVVIACYDCKIKE